MARSIRSHLETRAGRLRLAIRGRPYNAGIGKGLRLSYRRNKTDGTWSRLYQGKLLRIGLADDYSDADGVHILTYHQAMSKIRAEVFGSDESAVNPSSPLTIGGAIDQYAADLKARGAGPTNATWLRYRVPRALASRTLGTVEAKELRAWRDALVAEGALGRASINRLMKCAKAAFSHSAALDPKRIRNQTAWSVGLQALPGAERSRNVVISVEETRAVVKAAYAVSEPFGTYVEVAAVTGSRVSQIARLLCGDVQPDRLLMPVSKKGRGRRAVDRKPVPVPPSLATRLLALAKGRDPEAALLLQPDGRPWLPTSHWRKFYAAATAAGLDATKVSIGALRHSSITRQLLRGTPVRLVADSHDTSVGQIEKTYSKYISHHGDAMLRAGMLDLAPADEVGNVVPIRAK